MGQRAEIKQPLVKYFLPNRNEQKRDAKDRVHDWNEIYHEYSIEEARVQAQRCLDCELPTCLTHGCPLGNSIPDWLRKVAEGKILEAAQLSMSTSNMPEICGRVCPQDNLCEGSCNIEHLWGAVQIGKIEKYLNDYAYRYYGGIPVPTLPPPTGFRVACIGAGPAGISCADELAKLGHKVVMYDKYPMPGGTLMYGIPDFKLEKHHIQRRMDYLAKMGVEFHGNTEIGKDIKLADLLGKMGFDAVFIGIGAVIGSSPRVEGEKLKGVYQATEFLSRTNLPVDYLPKAWQEPLPKPKSDTCVVFGGGDTSIDCVRSALRIGYKKACVLYRRSEKEMPANRREVKSAIEEGAEFKFLHAPARFIGDENGNVVAAECYRMELGEPDEDGRRKPVKVAGSEFRIPCDRIILAIGYSNDPEIPQQEKDLVADKWGVVRIDERTGATTMKGVFCGGDARRGADLVVTAVLDGRIASRGIASYLTTLPRKNQPQGALAHTAK